ncbi:MAG: gamma-glutamyl-gamma-aminobutyrate hydrolase family protein [Solobacterium sp.]|nr:gamma-glutamyl-gamma-aminobutyrate hydrolase family protein [Solobacterium sp.]MCH4222702.1 gamma-glutamyl-gamma-aminobutyrate hydrolase family protein [Solobacterium sp.]
MQKPMILLTPRAVNPNGKNRIYYDNESYFTFIRNNGGIPVLSGTVDETIAAKLAEQMDGLLVTGGEDIDPARFGEENTYSEVIDQDLEETDILLYRAFCRLQKPVLGICRGIQIINVADGGTLIQDIHAYDRHALEHNQSRRVPPIVNYMPSHMVKFVPGTRLYDLFGETYGVNSFHHQAILKPADGFTVSAFSQDGLIEAIEKDHVTAVQWHPERMIHDEKHQEIMKRFVKDCQD